MKPTDDDHDTYEDYMARKEEHETSNAREIIIATRETINGGELSEHEMVLTLYGMLVYASKEVLNAWEQLPNDVKSTFGMESLNEAIGTLDEALGNK